MPSFQPNNRRPNYAQGIYGGNASQKAQDRLGELFNAPGTMPGNSGSMPANRFGATGLLPAQAAPQATEARRPDYTNDSMYGRSSGRSNRLFRRR